MPRTRLCNSRNSWISNLRTEDYDQLLIWPATTFDMKKDQKFLQKAMRDRFGIKHELVIVGTVETLPGEGGRGGRSDLFWLVHKDDVARFSNIKRLRMGIRWWEDIFYNNGEGIYPAKFRMDYPRKW